MLKSASTRLDSSTSGGKARVIEETLERLAQVPDEVKRDLLLQQLAVRFGMEVQVLRRRLRGPEVKESAPQAVPPGSPVEVAAEQLLALLLSEPGHVATVRTILTPEEFPTERTRRIADKLYAWEGSAGDFVSILERPEDRAQVAELALRELSSSPIDEQIHGCLDTLHRHRYRELRKAPIQSADADEQLRRISEARKSRGSDHGIGPGRFRR